MYDRPTPRVRLRTGRGASAYAGHAVGGIHLLGSDAFGHSGADGSLGFADPASGVAYAHARRRFAFPSGRGAFPENGRLAQSVLRVALAV